MCFGQHFKVRILKKLSLTLIMNFLEFHRRKDKKTETCENSRSG